MDTDIPYFSLGIETDTSDPYVSKWTWLHFAAQPEAKKTLEAGYWADNVMSIKLTERCDGTLTKLLEHRIKRQVRMELQMLAS